MGVANHRGDGVYERLRHGASDFGGKPVETVPLLRAEGNRVIAVVVDPVAGPDLTIVALARRNPISFWLWEVLLNRRSMAASTVHRLFGSFPRLGGMAVGRKSNH